jgi:cell division protein FtsI (penicillin-binding protein 3)
MAVRTLRPDVQDTLRRRLPVVVFLLLGFSVLLLYQLASFQWLSPEVSQELALRGEANYQSIRRLPAQRGLIYDRDGEALAINMLQYEIGASPNLITGPEELAIALGAILNVDELALKRRLEARVPWVQIARPVSAEIGQQISDLDQFGITIAPIPRRFYPQGALAGQVIGFVIEDDQEARLKGAIGVEGFYDDVLSGQEQEEAVSNLPFGVPESQEANVGGQDIVLTIDRDLQFWAESELLYAIDSTGSDAGTIIIMDPRNGDILAMTSYPLLDPNNFAMVEDPKLLRNPAISDIYEPGSVMKVLTVAAGLDTGAITPDWTYTDQGVREVGGISIYNWDRQAKGLVDTTQVLVQSLNIGATEIALAMGPDRFYGKLGEFGLGRRTGIPLLGEGSGTLKTPGTPDWTDSDLATNSFGQGISVTPLQMITAVAAIANDGLMYQPRVVRQLIEGGVVTESEPTLLGRPISAETANIVTDMLVRAVNEGATRAAVPGYLIAGKTGTAQIPSPIGYERDTSIVTFTGFFPADDPVAVVLIKLDRPDGYWGSEVAAPVFKRLAERLMLLMQIPTDDIRYALAAQGGDLGAP